MSENVTSFDSTTKENKTVKYNYHHAKTSYVGSFGYFNDRDLTLKRIFCKPQSKDLKKLMLILTDMTLQGIVAYYVELWYLRNYGDPHLGDNTQKSRNWAVIQESAIVSIIRMCAQMLSAAGFAILENFFIAYGLLLISQKRMKKVYKDNPNAKKIYQKMQPNIAKMSSIFVKESPVLSEIKAKKVYREMTSNVAKINQLFPLHSSLPSKINTNKIYRHMGNQVATQGSAFVRKYTLEETMKHKFEEEDPSEDTLQKETPRKPVQMITRRDTLYQKLTKWLIRRKAIGRVFRWLNDCVMTHPKKYAGAYFFDMLGGVIAIFFCSFFYYLDSYIAQTIAGYIGGGILKWIYNKIVIKCEERCQRKAKVDQDIEGDCNKTLRRKWTRTYGRTFQEAMAEELGIEEEDVKKSLRRQRTFPENGFFKSFSLADRKARRQKTIEKLNRKWTKSVAPDDSEFQR